MSVKVMYFILRSDLSTTLNWPLGAIFTQIAHAATACIWTFREDKEVVDYMNEMDTMHKVTLKVSNFSLGLNYLKIVLILSLLYNFCIF